MYNEKEEKLTLIDQRLNQLSPAVLDLYSIRTKHLDLSTNLINNLSWLNLFPIVETVLLDNNCLTDNALIKLNIEGSQRFYNVTTLSLNGNKLEKLSLVLKVIKKFFPNLEYLSLLKNPACPDGLSEWNNGLSYGNYRQKVATILPSLKFLDYSELNRKFLSTGLESKQFFFKFSPRILFAKLISQPQCKYTPLSDSVGLPGEHCGSYGFCLQKYIGNHSEGNRFIYNKDL